MVISRSGISLIALLLAGVPSAFGRWVKVLATNMSTGGIQYSTGSWDKPTQFNWGPEDIRGQGGPNSTVCEMDVPTRLSATEGESFSFSFRGISVQLVMSSRPDHAPFSVEYDGQTYLGDTYSQVVHCGAAWSSPVAAAVGDHKITCTNHPYRTRVFLELLSIQYDDGSDLAASATVSQNSSQTPTGRATGSGALSPGAAAGVAVGSAALAVFLLLAAFFVWRIRRATCVVRPLHIAPANPETTTRKSLAALVGTDGGHAHTTLPTVPAQGGAPEMRLADGDIDRIALRMNEMLGARGLPAGAQELDRPHAATSLPPY